MKNSNIDPMKGVVKPETLRDELNGLRDGKNGSRQYIRGSLMYLERHPPNPHIVPLLKHALEKYR